MHGTATIFFAARFCVSTIRGWLLFLWKAGRHQRRLDKVRVIQWQLLDTVSSTRSLSVPLSAVETSCTTQTALVLAWWPSSQMIRRCVPPQLLFKGGVYFTQSFRLCSYYLRAVTIRGRRLFEEIRYTSSKKQVGTTEQGYSGKVTLTCSPIICIRFCRYRKETITSWDLGMRLVRSVSLIFKNESECWSVKNTGA